MFIMLNYYEASLRRHYKNHLLRLEENLAKDSFLFDLRTLRESYQIALENFFRSWSENYNRQYLLLHKFCNLLQAAVLPLFLILRC